MSLIQQTVDNILYDGQIEIIHQLSETASRIALQNFEWRYTTLLFFNSTLWCGVELFLRSYAKAVVIGHGTFYPSYARDTRQYVLFDTSITNIVNLLKWMQKHEFDNTGRHIIICNSENESECDETFAMRELWQYKVTNVIFLKANHNNVAGFTYYPLGNSECHYHDPVLLENLTLCLDVVDPCDLFPIKFINLHGCPLIASTFIQPPFMMIEDGIPRGSDGELLRLLAERLNVNLSVMMPRIGDGWGKLEKDFTWSGSLADLYYDYANLSITSAALTLGRFSTFQLSTAYSSVKVIWITHTANKVPSSLKLTYPFQEDSRVALLVSFIFVVISAFIIQSRLWFRFSRKLKMKGSRHGIIFYSWMICMGLPATKLPRKTAFLYIVLLWIWYCVFIRTCYQVSLITVMKTNYYFTDFDTIHEAIEADYVFGGGSALRDYYLDDPIVYNKWVNVNSIEILPTLRELGKGKSFVLSMNLESAKTMVWEEKIPVHLLAEKVAVSPTVIFFKRFSPIVHSVNIVLVRLVEAGFREKFYRDYTNNLAFNKHVGQSLEVIKLEHFTGCYAILLAGWFTSFLFFVSEILFYRLYRHRVNT